jgi:6-phosphogluconolactonase
VSTGTRSRLLVAGDAGEFARTAADFLSRRILEAAKARGVCSIALSGGSTPKPVYELLGGSEFGRRIPWDQLEIYFADERAVPIDHPESNYELVRTTLLREHPEAWGRMIRMPADAADRNAAAERYGRRFPDPLDLLVLGMGADGHTASLFPGSPALDERERRVVAVSGAPKPPAERMTITPPVIERARTVVVLVSGVEKAQMVWRALDRHDDPREVPAQLARRGTWIVDHGAATRVLTPG